MNPLELERIPLKKLEEDMRAGKMNIDFWHYMNPPEEPVDEWEEIYSKMHKHRQIKDVIYANEKDMIKITEQLLKDLEEFYPGCDPYAIAVCDIDNPVFKELGITIKKEE